MIIALEGIDGSGKTTILNELKIVFNNNEHVVFFHTPISPFEEIRDCFGKENSVLNSFIFYHTSNIYFIKKVEQYINHRIIVLDRFVFSTYAAHAAWGDNALNKLMLKILKDFKPYFPQKTFLIRVSMEIQQKRLFERDYLADEEGMMLGCEINQRTYDWYYNKSIKKLKSINYSSIEILKNNFPIDLKDNIKIVSSYIDEYINKEIQIGRT